ncbi:hypothetical protein [Bacillus changyiensis]|uniref:hypothetical protein n=1 Tax=Bacillus changyiensis TaxID=3004103 RepID=UPI0022DECAB4|nr:hypothetical protein [Bacillus changyiensis]MDA1477937.1 hypothetical protein [Bacillus changyiensis]
MRHAFGGSSIISGIIIRWWIDRLDQHSLTKEKLVNTQQVKKRLGQKTLVFIDDRAHSRYTGDSEPLDHLAGHIPDTNKIFWAKKFHKKMVDIKAKKSCCNNTIPL